MKEMEYKYLANNEQFHEILDRGTYNGYEYCIILFGSHPCAYVVIPEDNPLYKKNYYDMDIDVHCGLTFGDTNRFIDDKWCIGWDYAHAGDYSSYYILFNDGLAESSKKWTTAEILEDVHHVIDQLPKQA